MKISEIEFDDEAFKAVVLAYGLENAEDITQIRARKSSIKSVKGIDFFKNLKLLDLTRNRISEIDLSSNLLLEELYIGNNQLEELDLSCNPNLTHVEVFMNDIAELDLSANKQLENLYANGNELSALDLSSSPCVEELQVSDNNLEKITLAEDTNLRVFRAENNFLPDSFKTAMSSSIDAYKLKL